MPTKKGRKKKLENQLIIRLPEDIDSDMVAFSREFARAQLSSNDFVNLTNLQKKLLTASLSKINWEAKAKSNVVEINNLDLMKKLGWDMSNSERTLKEVMANEFYEIIKNSSIKLKNPYNGQWHTGSLVTNAWGDNLFTYVEFNHQFMPHLENLYQLTAETKQPFITIMEPDVLSFSSTYSYNLYLELKSCSKSGGAINTHKMSTKQLKDLFGLPYDAYVSGGKFNRTRFEERVLIPAIEGINASEMIQILSFQDGKYFEKEKRLGKVAGYVFKYKVLNRENMVSKRKKEMEKKEKTRERQEGDKKREEE